MEPTTPELTEALAAVWHQLTDEERRAKVELYADRIPVKINQGATVPTEYRLSEMPAEVQKYQIKYLARQDTPPEIRNRR